MRNSARNISICARSSALSSGLTLFGLGGLGVCCRCAVWGFGVGGCAATGVTGRGGRGSSGTMGLGRGITDGVNAGGNDGSEDGPGSMGVGVMDGFGVGGNKGVNEGAGGGRGTWSTLGRRTLNPLIIASMSSKLAIPSHTLFSPPPV